MRISSSMICWNEAQTIDLALKSLVGFADEVVIVDTGSFDGTQKIAQEVMETLGLSGQIKQTRVTRLVDARLESFSLCDGDWVLMQDSNLVLSNALKRELMIHAGTSSNVVGSVRSLNLMGDYSHCFKNLPFTSDHRIFVRKESAKWHTTFDRPKFVGKRRKFKYYSVNLSRVRPAWRSWYRGEPFDSRYFKRRSRTWSVKKTNTQRQWMKSNKYYSLVEYIEAEKGLTLKDVKRLASSWHLKQLQIEAKPLKPRFRRCLPEAIKQELKNPRYRLKKRRGRIIGRWPEL